MKRKAPQGYLPKANKITKKSTPIKPKTIKDLPLEIIHKISKYGQVPFNPRKDIGPLEPKNIDMSVNLRDTQDFRHGELTQSMLSSNSVLRRSEQGAATEKQTRNETINILSQKRNHLSNEYNMLQAIYGKYHPVTRNIFDKWIEADMALWDSVLE